ncbi:NAD(P)-dependent oxidoreductase [Spirulina sp. CS-785/01]|uniref:NAD-dependent epimerase/dehydratase family protein n=1 Tax=Spirulina sp. CS-785/01 TaxID=3021716 RepID=UPI00232FBD04|nr:NAD(P)-dependent oxidoreductase [Spirulina sp. CS-785/01]MDB9313053.1 NAD(P)-dependent oxidoreductase [Spirulina sp. CS-785/01]
MKTVLVTGGSGFVGHYTLRKLLDKGYDVHVVTRNKTGQQFPSEVTLHYCDLQNVQQQIQLFQSFSFSHLLHFAWYTVPQKYWSSSENLNWVQVSINLVQNFVKSGGQRIVCAGTCAEYDWSYGYCSEYLTPQLPNTLYGTCKNSLRVILEQYCKEKNISLAWGRIFFLYGPHEPQQKLIPSTINSLLNGEFAYCTHGNQIRDFLYVEDVADAFVALLDSEVQGSVNIGSGQPIAIKEVVEKIGDLLGSKSLIQLGAIASRPNESPLLVANTKRLIEEVNFRPKTSLLEGLDLTINWWRQLQQ